MKITCTLNEQKAIKSLCEQYIPCVSCTLKGRCAGTKCSKQLDNLIEWEIVKEKVDEEHDNRVQATVLIKTYAKVRQGLNSIHLGVVTKLFKEKLSSLNVGLNPNNIGVYADFSDGNKWLKSTELYSKCRQYERKNYNRFIPKEQVKEVKQDD